MIKPTIENGIETIHCDTASEFLDYLQIRNERWLPKGASSSPWVFRGQQDREDWRLIPSAMRSAWINRLKEKYIHDAMPLIGQTEFDNNQRYRWFLEAIFQRLVEYTLVNQFVTMADQVGHPIPEEDLIIKEENLTLKDDKKTEKPMYDRLDLSNFFGGKGLFTKEPLPIEICLAQHHGIPTKLLDWTSSSFIAAYFPAEEIVQTFIEHKKETSFSIVLWAINKQFLEKTDLAIVQKRKGKIEYLRAQGGLFLYDLRAYSYYAQHGIWRSFDEVILSADLSLDTPVLRKITLAPSGISDLLRLLRAEGISRAHLMPTYDNVTKTLEIQEFMDEFWENET